MNLLLYEEALKHKDKITIHFNHKLTKVDFAYKDLYFDTIDEKG